MIKRRFQFLLGCLLFLAPVVMNAHAHSGSNIPDSDEVSGCLIVGEPRTICDWRSDVYTVLNACYTQGPGANCQWWQGSGIYINGPSSIISGPGNWPASTMNEYVQIIATNAQNHPPSAGYRLYSYSVTTVMVPGGGCNLQVTPVFRKVACEAPPSTG